MLSDVWHGSDQKLHTAGKLISGESPKVQHVCLV
jgi:hypothetical protein